MKVQTGMPEFISEGEETVKGSFVVWVDTQRYSLTKICPLAWRGV